MKKYIIYLFVILVLFNANCNKDSLDNSLDMEKNTKVEQFVLSLKQGEYTSGDLLDFTPDDITALLGYANDYSEIVYFPTSDICSYALMKFRLGECILWNIESLRINYPYEDRYLQFPSCTPMLIHKDYLNDSKINSSIDPEEYRLNIKQLDTAFRAYKDWWVKNSKNKFDKTKTINPLKNLDFFWY